MMQKRNKQFRQNKQTKAKQAIPTEQADKSKTSNYGRTGRQKQHKQLWQDRQTKAKQAIMAIPADKSSTSKKDHKPGAYSKTGLVIKRK